MQDTVQKYEKTIYVFLVLSALCNKLSLYSKVTTNIIDLCSGVQTSLLFILGISRQLVVLLSTAFVALLLRGTIVITEQAPLHETFTEKLII